ncbi:hypothetical protein I4U23_005210 [Adineta vaga]|uniref:Diadenosine tetraphosphate hydrolase HIT family-like protein n=1 Tax=Adineta vaga TaxID=104782 RepID=B3G4N1_ADIVA|nr:diadenosine tetraphosphate hydrolase HIT family-like protein [Adineta vaga]UJR18308.1 hypothetical protein I4U23_005210 [Adineta vaga]
MATNQNDLSDKLSNLSIERQDRIENNDGIHSNWSIPHSIRDGSSFRCQLTLKQLIDRQISQRYFQELLYIIEQDNQILDFHMRLRPCRQEGLIVDFIYNDKEIRSGPVNGGVCISCDMDNKLSQLSSIQQNSTTSIWLDAQLRKKLIVTPKRHIERLSDMTDEEMILFWKDTQLILNEVGVNWQSMIINHGLYRNHFHLHMKINIEQNQWNQFIQNRYKDKIEQMNDLLSSSEDNPIQQYFGDRQFNHRSPIKKLPQR